MKQLFVIPFALLFTITLFSCKKDKAQRPLTREEQIEQEIKVPLASNEMLEQEGIRFILNYKPEQAQLHLKLSRQSTSAPVSLDEEQKFVNYSALCEKLEENAEYILTAEFPKATAAGNFDITFVGFTDLNATKSFVISGIPYTTSSQGTSVNIVRIKRGINKFSFYKL